MKIQTMPLGMFGANCYLLTDSQNNLVLIDPADSKPILKQMEKEGLTLKAILLTHGHFDHIWGVKALQEKTGCDVICHEADLELLHAPSLAAGAFGLLSCPPCDANIVVKDGDSYTAGEMWFDFLHTPGHSKGSIVIVTQDILFTGDTVFAGSVGRTDLYGGDSAVLIESIKKIAALNDDKAVYPGHGKATTLENERRCNPYFIRAAKKEVSYDDLF